MEINKNNVFYRNRHAIADVSQDRDVDLGVATDMWAAEHGVRDTAAKNEWQSMLTYYQRHKTLTLADLLR